MPDLRAGLALLALLAFLPGTVPAAGGGDLDRLKLGTPVFGKPVQLKDLAGKVVVWRTWSG